MEEWRDIKGFEDSYQVSSKGRVKSKDRMVKAAKGSLQMRKGQIITGTMMPNGYIVVGLWRDCKASQRYIHRLVAEAFIPQPKGLNEINHIDEDKTNNIVPNLEWCNHKYNLNYGSVKDKIGKANRNGKFWSRRVGQYKDGILIATYPSSAEAERQTGICSSSIRKVCLGKPKFLSAGGFEWREILYDTRT